VSLEKLSTVKETCAAGEGIVGMGHDLSGTLWTIYDARRDAFTRCHSRAFGAGKSVAHSLLMRVSQHPEPDILLLDAVPHV
jgi:hypothetical protein